MKQRYEACNSVCGCAGMDESVPRWQHQVWRGARLAGSSGNSLQLAARGAAACGSPGLPQQLACQQPEPACQAAHLGDTVRGGHGLQQCQGAVHRWVVQSPCLLVVVACCMCLSTSVSNLKQTICQAIVLAAYLTLLEYCGCLCGDACCSQSKQTYAYHVPSVGENSGATLLIHAVLSKLRQVSRINAARHDSYAARLL